MTFTPLTFVYLGRRVLSSGAMGHAIEIQTPEPKTLFTAAKDLKSRTIGGVYHGAEFNDDLTAIRSLDRIQYLSQIADHAAISEWTARDVASQVEHRRARDEKAAKVDHDALSALVQLRTRYARADMAGRRALEAYVLDLLRKGP